MKIEAKCGIGFYGAEHKEEFDIPDDELEGKDADGIEQYIFEEYLIP